MAMSACRDTRTMKEQPAWLCLPVGTPPYSEEATNMAMSACRDTPPPPYSERAAIMAVSACRDTPTHSEGATSMGCLSL